MSSKFLVVAQNMAKAPATFVIDVFKAEPSALLIYPRRDPAWLFRADLTDHPEHGSTDPGKYVKIELELNYEAKRNAKGVMLWVAMPFELRGRFMLRTLEWNGESLMRTSGII